MTLAWSHRGTRLDSIKNLRADTVQWKHGGFVEPHDACFTPEGHIYVAEWAATGRVTKLEKA